MKITTYVCSCWGLTTTAAAATTTTTTTTTTPTKIYSPFIKFKVDEVSERPCSFTKLRNE